MIHTPKTPMSRRFRYLLDPPREWFETRKSKGLIETKPNSCSFWSPRGWVTAYRGWWVVLTREGKLLAKHPSAFEIEDGLE